MNPVRTLLQQNSIRALLKIEKSIYDITKGRCAKKQIFILREDSPCRY